MTRKTKSLGDIHGVVNGIDKKKDVVYFEKKHDIYNGVDGCVIIFE